jgi:hypothetical protein
MLVRRVVVENVRSFLARAELILDGPINILIGPNGGGKTNLLDIAVVMLRRHLLASMYPAPAPLPEQQERYEFRPNDMLNNMALERHSRGKDRPQYVEIEIEISARDVENIDAMRRTWDELRTQAERKYLNIDTRLNPTRLGSLIFQSGQRLVYRWKGGALEAEGEAAKAFLHYLNSFEIDSFLRAEMKLAQLSMPMLYLPVTRANANLQSDVDLYNFNEAEQKRQLDATLSRSVGPIVSLALSRIAKTYRRLLDTSRNARDDLRKDPSISSLTEQLEILGYKWELETINPEKNQYGIRLEKEGHSFLLSAASSGEKEFLTYLFAIFALNVRDALIIVDEPELHLHPRWQKKLLGLFGTLSALTGNQFVLATHSPTFISPDSIRYVSRVFSRDQQSHILRLSTEQLPNAKFLLHIVNSQNNESIFFADEVVLVEGLSDRLFFETVFDKFGRESKYAPTLEVVSVGGKSFFEAYKALLVACQVSYSIIADRDYLSQVGSTEVKSLFKLDSKKTKSDLNNPESHDADALVSQIEHALASGSWDSAKATWEYLKSRRTRSKLKLSEPEQRLLANEISE